MVYQFVLRYTPAPTPEPEIRRAWQSTDDLIAYAEGCCVWRELTPGERQQFGLPLQ